MSPRKNRVLVLGSTPELRDLLLEEECHEIVVADMSEAMISGMSRYMRRASAGHEKWIYANWLELPYPPGSFDIILGDVVLHQVSPALENTFLAEMSHLLAEEGSFISRFFFLDQKFLQLEPGAIADAILELPCTGRQKAKILNIAFIWRFADLKRRTFDRQRSSRVLNAVLVDEKYASIRGQGALHTAPGLDGSRDWSPPDDRELLRIIGNFFEISGRKHASDYLYAEYFPTLCLKKK